MIHFSDGWAGRKCECELKGRTTSELEKKCKDPNDQEGKVCNEKGTCQCGICKCDDTQLGKFCTYNKEDQVSQMQQTSNISFKNL